MSGLTASRTTLSGTYSGPWLQHARNRPPESCCDGLWTGTDVERLELFRRMGLMEEPVLQRMNCLRNNSWMIEEP